MNRHAVVITALEVEFAAIADQLTNCDWTTHPHGTRYLVGGYGDWTIALAEIGRGNEEAGHATERALEFFQPSVALFVGVAGGVKDVALGDVVFATEVHGYEYGKETSDAFLPRGQIGMSSHMLIEAARQLRYDQRSTVDYAVVIEPIAAGGKVVADAKAPTAQLIQKYYSQVVATEQEGLGFLKAAKARQAVPVGVVRGISDLLSDKGKSDAAGWQETAARNVAQFSLSLLGILAPPEPVTIETVTEHMMKAWLRLRGWTNLDDFTAGIPHRLTRLRTQRLLDELHDILVDRLEQRWPNTRPTVGIVQGLVELTRDPPAQVDIGTIKAVLSDTDGFGSDVAAFLVEAYLAIPELRPDGLADLVERATELRDRLEGGLNSMPNRHVVVGESVSNAIYGTDYLRAVGHRLDTLQILGIDLARAVERYSLTTAYVSLSAGSHTDVANVLASSKRLLLVGEAGSGKTTLLQWVAVTTARGQLDHWGPQPVPFLVRLRHYTAGPMPDVEDFPTEVAATLASRKPPHWCSEVLREGNGVVLIDGLDELPADRRATVQEWLDDLFSAFPDNVFIVTSRPAALRDNSFKLTNFDIAELIPMGATQITAFVKHWHESTGRNLPTADRPDHQSKGDLLAEHILATPALRDLARTPLLCAVLCALAYSRKGVGSLPRRRVELYQAALEMLSGRRDSERRIAAADLSSTERLTLLESLAQWLVRNGQSEIPRENALRHIERTLRALRTSVTVEGALQDLVERSILREPTAEVLDFVHRTFAEYLAARWMNDQGDIGVLLDKAGDPAFHEVIVLVAGLARPREAEELITKLIDMADQDTSLYPLAASCVDASLKVEPEIVSRLQRYYATLVPPADNNDVLLLTTGGDTSVVLLERFLSESDTDAAMGGLTRSVQTLARIGTPAALRVLAELPDELRLRLVQDLVNAWSFFQPGEYAAKVLRPLGTQAMVTLFDATRIRFTRSLSPDYVVRALLIPGVELTSHVTSARLHHLEVDDYLTEDEFAVLAGVEDVKSISSGISFNGTPFTIPPRPTLSSLQLACIAPFPLGLDCAMFSVFPNLTELQLTLLGGMTLANVNALNELPHLRLVEVDGPVDLADVRIDLPELRVLRLSHWPHENFIAIAGCTALESLDATSSDEVASLDGLEELTQLRTVNLASCKSLSDISGLNGLQVLEQLNLTGCVGLDEYAHDVIENLTAGIEVELSGSRLDFDLSNTEFQARTTDTTDVWADSMYITDPADMDDWYENGLIRSVVGAYEEDDGFHSGWLVGNLTEIEYPSSAAALAADEGDLEGLGKGLPPGTQRGQSGLEPGSR